MSLPDFSGTGYLAGEAPDGLTTVVAVPVPATVQVLWRDPETDEEHLVASTTSASDGTWRITGLNHELEYVVRGIKDGWNDVTVVGVTPTRMDVVTATGVLETNEDSNGVAGSMLIEGGLPPYSVSVIDPLPYGLAPAIDYRTLTIVGTSDDWGTWDATLRVTASNAVYVDVPVSLIISSLWTPELMATPPAVCLDWDSAVTAVSGYASAWSNSKGAIGGEFVQATAASRPAVLDAEINGKRVLRFDGADDSMGSKSTDAINLYRNSSSAWVFAVYRKRSVDSGSTARAIFGASTASTGYARFVCYAGRNSSETANQPSVLSRRADGDALHSFSLSGVSSTAWQMVLFIRDWSGASASIKRNGGVASTTTAGTPGVTSDTSGVDGLQIGFFPIAPLDADVAAIIAGADVSLSDGEIQRLEGYAAHRLALQALLPADHPFRSVAPHGLTPELQQSFGTAPVVLGFVAAASGADVGAATGPAVTTLGTLFSGGPSLSAGQGVEVISNGTIITVTLTSLTPPATPAQAVLLDHKGMPIATVVLTASGSDYIGTVAGELDDGAVYYLRIEAA